jgi:hypothetical protein
MCVLFCYAAASREGTTLAADEIANGKGHSRDPATSRTAHRCCVPCPVMLRGMDNSGKQTGSAVNTTAKRPMDDVKRMSSTSRPSGGQQNILACDHLRFQLLWVRFVILGQLAPLHGILLPALPVRPIPREEVRRES